MVDVGSGFGVDVIEATAVTESVTIGSDTAGSWVAVHPANNRAMTSREMGNAFPGNTIGLGAASPTERKVGGED